MKFPHKFLCVGPVSRSKYVQFPIICSLQYSININTVEVHPHSDLLHICIVKLKFKVLYAYTDACCRLVVNAYTEDHCPRDEKNRDCKCKYTQVTWLKLV